MPRFAIGDAVYILVYVDSGRPVWDGAHDTRSDNPCAACEWQTGSVTNHGWSTDHLAVLINDYQWGIFPDYTEGDLSGKPIPAVGFRPPNPPAPVDTRVRFESGDILYFQMVREEGEWRPRWSGRHPADRVSEGTPLRWVRGTVASPGGESCYVTYPGPRRTTREFRHFWISAEVAANRPGSPQGEMPPDFTTQGPALHWCSWKAHRADSPARPRPAVQGCARKYHRLEHTGTLRPMCDECWSGFAGDLASWADAERHKTKLHGYHDNDPLTRGFFSSHGEVAPTRFFGVELEMVVEGLSDGECQDPDEDGEPCGQCSGCDGESDHSTHWYSSSALHDRCQAATDSSISSGYEIISAPMTLREHTRYWLADSRKRALRDYDVDRTTGMHVHINRSALSDLTICKMQEFLADGENTAFVAHVAGRQNNSYCERPNKRKFTSLDDSRYCALNVSNEATVEFRIFAGTNRADRVVANIEFCDALVSFCEESSLDALTERAFRFWVKSKVKAGHRYRALNALIGKAY